MDRVTPTRPIIIRYSTSLRKGKLFYIARRNKKVIASAESEELLKERVKLFLNEISLNEQSNEQPAVKKSASGGTKRKSKKKAD